MATYYMYPFLWMMENTFTHHTVLLLWESMGFGLTTTVKYGGLHHTRETGGGNTTFIISIVTGESAAFYGI